jgi:hypothetical protein
MVILFFTRNPNYFFYHFAELKRNNKKEEIEKFFMFNGSTEKNSEPIIDLGCLDSSYYEFL